MSPRPYYAIFSFLTILLLIIPTANAAPHLSPNNQANYNLTGQIKTSTSCTGTPAQYAPYACANIPFPTPVSVSIFDNNTCTPSSFGCGFSPSGISVQPGTNVIWTNNGRLTHTVTADNTTNGLPIFNSGAINPGLTFSNTFTAAGNYQYHCSIHPWMKGTVDVNGLPPPVLPSTPTSVQVNLDGNVGWTVKGLSTEVANLRVNHTVAVSISPLPGVTFTPTTEKGSFEQTTNLATRVESPSTAYSIIKQIAQYYSSYIYGLPYGYYSFPLAALSQLGSRTPNYEHYTMWWVNGPIGIGTPVEILTGTSSVTGDESLNLGTTLGTREGWLVTSEFAQSVNTTSPPQGLTTPGSTNNLSFALNLVWSFDKHNDLLLRSDAAATVLTTSTFTQQLFTGNPCGPQGWCPKFVPVALTRTTSASIDLALRLSATDLNLNTRAVITSTGSSTPTGPGSAPSPGPTSNPATSFLTMLSNLALPIGAIGAVAAALVGAGVWYLNRVRGRRAKMDPGSVPPTAPPFPA